MVANRVKWGGREMGISLFSRRLRVMNLAVVNYGINEHACLA